MTRPILTVVALIVSAHVAFAQAAPATKAPAEPPSLLTRVKRMVGLEKAPAPAPVVKPAARRDTATPATPQGAAPASAKTGTKAAGKQAQVAPATKAPATKAPATKAPATKAPATTAAGKAPAVAAPANAAATKSAATVPATKVAPKGTAGAPGATGTKQGGLTVAPEMAPRVNVPVIMREVFTYESEGRRDPFFSLLATSELRPALVDLRLTGLIYDPSGRRSVAIMRDMKDNTQYRVTTGMQLGRMRVALIKPRSVIFSIEEFGLNRQDSLVLGDTTKVRAK